MGNVCKSLFLMECREGGREDGVNVALLLSGNDSDQHL